MSAAWTAALAVEARKLVASRVVQAATVLIVAGIAVLVVALDTAAEAGNERILAQLGDLAAEHGWTRLVGVATQITAAASLLGFGVVLAWVVGREFADGTISGLFALPVRRATIVAAKLAVYVAWTVAVAVALVTAIAVVGVVVGAGSPDAAGSLARLLALTVLSGLLATPAAWVATLGRGPLPGIASTVVTIVIAQVMAVAGTGAWFPVAAPALWALDPDAVSALQLGLVTLVPLVFGLLTIRTWSHLQLDR
jgi:ABC-2 type transport system permease protein